MVIDIYNDWILISSLGLLFSSLFTFDPYVWLMENVFPFKPFNCVLCFSFWSSLIILGILGESLLGAIYVAFIAELSYRKLVM